MDGTVVDYSWARPAPTCLRASGIVGVARYLSPDTTGKNLTVREADALHAAGLWILINWEGRGNWSEFSAGAQGGADAGRIAFAACDQMDVPTSVPVFVSADYGAPRGHWSAIETWLKAFRVASGRRIGFYGQGNLADWLLDRGTIGWIWQTNAHGWGGVSGRAVLYQHIWTKLCGADVDPNTLTGNPADWAWMPGTPTPTPEDDMTPNQAAQLKKATEAATQANLRSAANQTSLAQLHDDLAPTIINGFYQTYVGRPPDPGGLAWALKAFRGGKPFAWIEQVVARSPEAKRHAAAE